tara:strand:+ start:1994 stop:2794 length:801 start_codon:yes stop_codon:yes gene_type:complete
MLELINLKTEFLIGDRYMTAVNDVSLTVEKGKTVGLVGESGSGKSVTSLSTLRLLPNNARCSGKILWKSQDLKTASESTMRAIRGREIAMIFQNPLAALNPVFTIANQMIETIMLHHPVTKEVAREKAIQLLDRVKIPNPKERINDYPHQFSLGMCQRIMIAITLAMKPDLIIADEPTASLDVTVQTQIMALLNELQEEHDMSMLLISHDLGVIAQNCDYIYIMYHGNIVEEGPTYDIFKHPKNAYTQALIAAIPSIEPPKKENLR